MSIYFAVGLFFAADDYRKDSDTVEKAFLVQIKPEQIKLAMIIYYVMFVVAWPIMLVLKSESH